MHVSVSRPVTAREILKGLQPLDLRNLARLQEITTGFMGACYIHRLRARSTADVRLSGTSDWTPGDSAVLENVHKLLTSQRLAQVDLRICASEPSYHLRLYVPLCHADLAYMASRAMLPAPADWLGRYQADVTAIVLPSWGEPRSILIDSGHSTAYILGSDYYGDIHNSVLRLVGHLAGRQGHLSLHAGSAELWVRRSCGDLKRCGLLIFGAGGAGKTTLATADYGLDVTAGEKAAVRQDDRVILHPNGFVQGTEGQGLYVRTLGLTPQNRPGLWPAVNHEDAILENVWINTDGSIDYRNDTLTTNGRAIVPLRQIPGFDGQVDVPKCTHAFFLVQDETMPAATRLAPAQASHLLPRTEEASAADQLAGDQARKAKAFGDFLQQNSDVLCFAINTGTAGRGAAARKVTPAVSAATIREICREDRVL